MSSGTIICLSIGLIFSFFGCVGLIRLPDIYNRLQAATKCVTLGVCFMLIAVINHCGILSATAIKAIDCIVFILVTSPTAAHAIARGAYHFGVKLWDKSVVDKYKDRIKKNEKA